MASPWRAAAGAAVASGLLLWVASPAVGAGWLAWVAVVPAAAVAITYRKTTAGRLVVPLAYVVYLELLLVPALPFGLANGQWAHPPMPLLIDGSPVLVVALVAVPVFGAALYALHFGSPWGATPLSAVLGPAAAWAALDLVRAQLDPGGLWGPLFLSQHDIPSAELAALAGPSLLTFAIVGVNYALAVSLVRRSPMPIAAAAGCLALLAAAAFAAATRTSGEALRVAAIQPGYDTAEEGRPELRYFEPGTRDRAALDTIRDLGRLSRGAAERGAQLIVWPEAALWVDPAADERVREALKSLARTLHTALIVPYFVPGARQGSTLAVTAGGRFAGAQPKQRPMWFLGEDGGNRSPPHPVAVGSVRLGSLMGVDNQNPGVPRDLTAAGASVLASSTHDWSQLAVQQRAFAQLHAAAVGEPIVRADWRYGSAIFDADGGRVADAGIDKTRVAVVGDVSAGGGRTLYARAGDLPIWIGLAVAGALALRRRTRTRGQPRARVEPTYA